jgi:hypothetical protein
VPWIDFAVISVHRLSLLPSYSLQLIRLTHTALLFPGRSGRGTDPAARREPSLCWSAAL